MRLTHRPTARPTRSRAAAVRAGIAILLGVTAATLASAAPASAAPGTAAAPVIRFSPDWSTTVEGAIVANAPVLIDFDPARLPACRAQYAGGDAWSIGVEYRIDGGAVQRRPVTELNSNRRQVKVLASLALGAGTQELELWFVSGDRAGCREYDSQYGANYRFAVAS
ncbi:DUF6209 family protein [Actinoplanes sp. NPDC049118]|uniref:DUF6209 family protein n=1 Tax=Actinoplanes sp. NPDC049118 TaxID=3155769 RepID=UPI0033C30AB8